MDKINTKKLRERQQYGPKLSDHDEFERAEMPSRIREFDNG